MQSQNTDALTHHFDFFGAGGGGGDTGFAGWGGGGGCGTSSPAVTVLLGVPAGVIPRMVSLGVWTPCRRAQRAELGGKVSSIFANSPRACGQFRTGASQRRGNGVKAARSRDFPAIPANQFPPASRAAASLPRRHPRAVTVERRGRVDWHGDNRARRGVIRARVKRKARRARLSQTGDGVPVQGR